MDKDKNRDLGEEVALDDLANQDKSASRARNRTVMLTPEMTGEVRARLAEDTGRGGPPPIPNSSFGGAPNGAPAPQPAFGNSFGGAAPRGAPAEGFVRPQTLTPPSARAMEPIPAAPPSYRAAEPVASFRAPAQSPTPAIDNSAGQEQLIYAKQGKVIGFLVSFDSNENGDVFELRKGRLIVTSESSSGGNFLVIRDETVSPMHAIIRIGGDGDVQVLDQLSEYGTAIISGDGSEKKLSGDKSEIRHGDVVKFGNRAFHVCMVVLGR